MTCLKGITWVKRKRGVIRVWITSKGDIRKDIR